MPAFLESDLYMEYRLANLVSQAKITGDRGEYILMRIDFKPKTLKTRKKVVEEEVQVDPKEQLMKEMYVCMGNTSTTDAEAWFTAASMATGTSVTSSSDRPKSAELKTKRPTSARPVSAYSSVDSYRRTESGYGSSIKSSLSVLKQSQEDNYDVYSSKLFAVDGKPMTPRPTDSVCAVTEDYSDKRRRPYSSTVYCTPKVENSDSESGFDVGDDTDSVDSKDKEENVMDLTQEEKHDAYRKGSSDGIVFNNIDDIGSAIVGAVLKRTLSSMLKMDENELPPSLIEQIPGSELSKSISLEHLENISLQEEVQLSEEDKEVAKVTESKSSDEKKEEESDADSLLDSEEDYEESDTFFRKHRKKIHKLTNRKGIERFKTFLSGTVGERQWNLWLDIDKTRFMTDNDAVQK